MENLDLKCAELGRTLAELKVDDKPIEEKVFTSALGVLEEQGPYACFLYLEAREGKPGQEIITHAMGFLRPILGTNANTDQPLDFLRALASDLDRLLFARDLLRQAFVYARYHAKARPGNTEKEA
jgi:hypothetical protein